MNSKELQGLEILLIDDASSPGRVSRAYVDGPRKKVIGFSYRTTHGLFEAEGEPNIDTGDIHSIGPAAITLDTGDSVRGKMANKRFGDLLDSEEMIQRPVISESGISLGHLASFDFDTKSFRLTGIEISHGRFSSNRSVPIKDVSTIGRDFIIVKDSVVTPE